MTATLPGWLLAVGAAPFVGSFLALAAVRLPRGETVARGRSRCRVCGAPLSPGDLVPVLSWAVLRGRCRHCDAPVPALHPLMEMAAVAVAASAALADQGWRLAAGCGLGWTLLLLAAIDLRARVLPDVLTLPLMAAGLGMAWLWQPWTWESHLLGAVLGYAGFAGIAVLYRRLRGREGLGLGDAKLLGAGGAWLGWPPLPHVVLVAAVAALAAVGLRALVGQWEGGDHPIPFGPFLALGIWLAWIGGGHPLLLAKLF